MKVVIVSGYFNPLHGGHLDMIEAAAALGDHVVVIVNNDIQQKLKKGKIILNEANRLRVVQALRDVDTAVISVDSDPTVIQSLRKVAEMFPDDQLVFLNGGDRDSDAVVPEAEVCSELSIEMVYDGNSKVDSSTRINQARGEEE